MKTKSTSHSLRLLAAMSLAGISFSQTSAHAADGTWIETGAGPFDWSLTNTASWDSGTVADGIDSTAFFTPDITATQTVNLAEARTIGNITFTDSTTSSHNLTISGASILTLDLTAGIPVIDVTQSNRTLTISSEIAGSDGLQKNGAGTLALSGANTYTGGTTLTAGVLSISNANSLSSGSVSVTGNARINSTGGITYANDISIASGAVLTMQNVGGNTTSTYSGAVTGLGGITNVTGSGGGSQTITLSNTNNTFTGDLTLATGTGANDFINFASIGDGGSIVYGRASWRANATYTGSADLNFASRSITLATTFGGASGYDGGGNPIHMFANNGTGVVTFAQDMVMTTTASSGIFFFGGTNTGNNTFAGAIADPTNASTLGIGKWDAGKWILSNNTNSFEGNVVLARGTLSVGVIDVAANAQPLGKGSLIVMGYRTADVGTLEYTGSGNAVTDKQIAVGTPASSTNTNFRGGGVILNNGTGTLTFSNTTFNSTAGVPASGTGRDRTLTLGGTNTGANTIAGTIQDNNNGTVNAKVFLAKSGSGTWVLNGANTYTGTTTISGGTLVITGASQSTTGITFTGGSLGLDIANTAAAAAATVDFTNGNVTVTGTPTLTSYTLLTASSISGVTPSTLSPTVPGYELQVIGGNELHLVSTGSPVGFAAWQAANGTSGGRDEDHDNDGVDNGTEHFLGGDTDTTGFTALPTVVNTAGTLSVTWTRHPNYPGFPGNYGTDFVVETSATLAGPWTPETVGGNVTITGNNVTYTFPGGPAYSGKNFARLKVTGP